MKAPPNELDGAKVLLWTPLDHRHRKTDSIRLYADGAEQISFAGLALAAYEKNGRLESGVYLFYCDADWQVQNDSLYGDLTEARAEAERQFLGVANTWKEP